MNNHRQEPVVYGWMTGLCVTGIFFGTVSGLRVGLFPYAYTWLLPLLLCLPPIAVGRLWSLDLERSVKSQVARQVFFATALSNLSWLLIALLFSMGPRDQNQDSVGVAAVSIFVSSMLASEVASWCGKWAAQGLGNRDEPESSSEISRAQLEAR